MTSSAKTRAFRTKAAGLALALVALFGFLLWPYCDLFDTHEREAGGPLVQKQAPRAVAIPGAGPASVLAGNDDATNCCAVIAARPGASGGDLLAQAGEKPQLAIATSLVRRSTEMRVHDWNTRRPGLPPIAALHARSAPLLS